MAYFPSPLPAAKRLRSTIRSSRTCFVTAKAWQKSLPRFCLHYASRLNSGVVRKSVRVFEEHVSMARFAKAAPASQVLAAQLAHIERANCPQSIEPQTVVEHREPAAIFGHAIRVPPFSTARNPHGVLRHPPSLRAAQLYPFRHRRSRVGFPHNQALQPTRIPWLRHSMRAAELGRWGS